MHLLLDGQRIIDAQKALSWRFRNNPGGVIEDVAFGDFQEWLFLLAEGPAVGEMHQKAYGEVKSLEV